MPFLSLRKDISTIEFSLMKKLVAEDGFNSMDSLPVLANRLSFSITIFTVSFWGFYVGTFIFL